MAESISAMAPGNTAVGPGPVLKVSAVIAFARSGDDMGHTVARDNGVSADELEAFMAGLGDQEGVERVAVMIR
jgi:hypothetical protein